MTQAEITEQVKQVKAGIVSLCSDPKKDPRIYVTFKSRYFANETDFSAYAIGGDKSARAAQCIDDIDKLLATEGVEYIRVRVDYRTNRTNRTETSFTINLTDKDPARVVVVSQSQKAQQAAPQQQQFSSMSAFADLFGLSILGDTGLGEITEKTGAAGIAVKLKEKMMQDKFDKENLQRENEELRKRVEELKSVVDALKKEGEKTADENDKLTDELAEYRRINPARDKISGIGGAILANALEGLARRSPVLAGLFGVEGTEPQTAQPQTEVVAQEVQPASEVSEVEIMQE